MVSALVDLDIHHPSRALPLIAATDVQNRVAFLPGVPLTLKALRKKDYSDQPKTLGEHLKKRRVELGLLQREVAQRLGCDVFTFINWEKDRTRPIASRFRPIIEFLGYDPTPAPSTLAERLDAKRRATGMTFDEVAAHLQWDPGSLSRYLDGTWRLSRARADFLERFLNQDLAATVLAVSKRRWIARS